MYPCQVILLLSALILTACDDPKCSTSESTSIDGIDVSAMDGWHNLSDADRAVVTTFIDKAKALDPAWLELQRASNRASNPTEFAAALDRFTEAVKIWLPSYLTARYALKEVDQLENAEKFLLLRLQTKDPDLNAIANDIGRVRKRFSYDPGVQSSLREFVLTARKIPGFKNQ